MYVCLHTGVHSEGDLGKEVTSQVGCVMHSEYMYKPCWDRTNREKIQKDFKKITVTLSL